MGRKNLTALLALVLVAPAFAGPTRLKPAQIDFDGFVVPSSSFSVISGTAAYSVLAGSAAVNGTNCSAGQFPLGVDRSWNVETCSSVLVGSATLNVLRAGDTMTGNLTVPNLIATAGVSASTGVFTSTVTALSFFEATGKLVCTNPGAQTITLCRGQTSTNSAANLNCTVSGGTGNRCASDSSVIAGGGSNDADSGGSNVISGGNLNTHLVASFGTISGGQSNHTSGLAGTVPGGVLNEATGAYSFAAGRRAKANASGSFAWADSQNADFVNNSTDSFRVRAQGGVQFTAPTSTFTGNVSAVNLSLSGTLSATSMAATTFNASGSYQVGGVTVISSTRAVLASTINAEASVSGANVYSGGTLFIGNGTINTTNFTPLLDQSGPGNDPAFPNSGLVVASSFAAGFGSGTTANGNNAIASGDNGTCDGDNSACLGGENNTVDGISSANLASSDSTNGGQNSAILSSNSSEIVSGENSSIMNCVGNCELTGDRSLLVGGQNNTLTANGAVVLTDSAGGSGTTTNDSFTTSFAGPYTITGAGAPPVGFALCLAVGNVLGHCTDTPAVDGSCTCTAP